MISRLLRHIQVPFARSFASFFPKCGRNSHRLIPSSTHAPESARFKLSGLDPNARYTIMNLDSGEAKIVSGRELFEKARPVFILDLPGHTVQTSAKLKWPNANALLMP